MNDILSFAGSHWLIIALMAPMFWSLVNIIDVYFVDGIYKDELDGTIISGLFQMVPWLILIFLVNIDFPSIINFKTPGNTWGSSNILVLSFIGGTIYILGIYFYFKALFHYNDAPFLQILANLTVIVVPILSFLIFREKLPLFRYTGMALTFIGAIMLSFSPHLRKKFSIKYFKIMLGAVFLLSLSMILEDRAYNLLGESYGKQGFWVGFLFFNLGAFVGASLLAFYFRRNPFPTIRKYYKIFFLGEGLYFFGTLSFQRAIDAAPSVSYVAVIETFGPVFIMFYSLIIIFLSSIVFRGRSETLKRIYSEQIGGIWVKVFATVIMAAGVYIISF